MLGDEIEVYVDVGAVEAKRFVVRADKAGRTVEVDLKRGLFEVSVLTRTKRVVKTDRFLQARVVALLEHRRDEAEDEAEPLPGLVVEP